MFSLFFFLCIHLIVIFISDHKKRTCMDSVLTPVTVLSSSPSPQFLLIFRKSAAGELAEDSGLSVLARLSEIDVSTEGVKGAKTFFEAKVSSSSDPPCPRLVVHRPQHKHERESRSHGSSTLFLPLH